MTNLRIVFIALGLLCMAAAAPGLRAGGPAANERARAAQMLADKIDQLIAAEWAAHQVKPAPLADDAEFLRRAYLDIAGRIPRVSEALEFLEDKGPDKRQRLIDQLLEGPGYVQHFGNIWRDLLLPQIHNLADLQLMSRPFEHWLRQQFRDSTPYDQMVRAIIAQPINPKGDALRTGPGLFFKANGVPEKLATSASRVFLGVKIDCAQCHDHPFQAELKRVRFWEFAAFFSGLQPNIGVQDIARTIGEQPDQRELKIPGTDQMVQARFLDGGPPEWKDSISTRQTLANWIASPNNPYFARAAANRLWAHFLGTGLIEPVEELGPDNEPSHPALLDELARQFVAHQFDQKFLIRAITYSKTYQLTSRSTDKKHDDPRLFARAFLRGLTAEQLLFSLALAIGDRELVDPEQRFQPARGNSPRKDFLQKFANHDKKTETQTSMAQAMTLMNGQFITDATSLQRSETLAAIADFPGLSTAQRIEKLYLATVSRKPRANELERLVKYVESGGTRQDPKTALADVFWVLLNSSEFILNH